MYSSISQNRTEILLNNLISDNNASISTCLKAMTILCAKTLFIEYTYIHLAKDFTLISHLTTPIQCSHTKLAMILKICHFIRLFNLILLFSGFGWMENLMYMLKLYVRTDSSEWYL